MNYEKLGDNIRACREFRGLTQEKLAELLNISEKHLSKIERGKINIKIDTLVGIAQALNMSVDKLLTDTLLHNDDKDYITQIIYHLSTMTKEEQAKLLWHIEQNKIFEKNKMEILKL